MVAIPGHITANGHGLTPERGGGVDGLPEYCHDVHRAEQDSIRFGTDINFSHFFTHRLQYMIDCARVHTEHRYIGRNGSHHAVV